MPTTAPPGLNLPSELVSIQEGSLFAAYLLANPLGVHWRCLHRHWPHRGTDGLHRSRRPRGPNRHRR
jgi:hypothetical protein